MCVYVCCLRFWDTQYYNSSILLAAGWPGRFYGLLKMAVTRGRRATATAAAAAESTATCTKKKELVQHNRKRPSSQRDRETERERGSRCNSPSSAIRRCCGRWFASLRRTRNGGEPFKNGDTSPPPLSPITSPSPYLWFDSCRHRSLSLSLFYLSFVHTTLMYFHVVALCVSMCVCCCSSSSRFD